LKSQPASAWALRHIQRDEIAGFHQDRQHAPLRHPGTAQRTGIAQDQDGVRSDVEILEVEVLFQFRIGIKDQGGSGVGFQAPPKPEPDSRAAQHQAMTFCGHIRTALPKIFPRQNKTFPRLPAGGRAGFMDGGSEGKDIRAKDALTVYGMATGLHRPFPAATTRVQSSGGFTTCIPAGNPEAEAVGPRLFPPLPPPD
jgi:hypothetical protein